jgi:hypothetical protein
MLRQCVSAGQLDTRININPPIGPALLEQRVAPRDIGLVPAAIYFITISMVLSWSMDSLVVVPEDIVRILCNPGTPRQVFATMPVLLARPCECRVALAFFIQVSS